MMARRKPEAGPEEEETRRRARHCPKLHCRRSGTCWRRQGCRSRAIGAFDPDPDSDEPTSDFEVEQIRERLWAKIRALQEESERQLASGEPPPPPRRRRRRRRWRFATTRQDRRLRDELAEMIRRRSEAMEQAEAAPWGAPRQSPGEGV